MKKVYMRSCVWLLVLLLMVPVGGFSQDTGSAPPPFRQEELDQMLAPIALYPDSLLIQMLMASTYPLEVVQAQRWLNSNPNLKDEQLAAALEQKDWDPSVKSLVNFPPVLAMMNDKLEWTQDLGDAFLGQQDQVMATVQDLRAKAHAQGNLKTTSEQVVVVQDDSILIEPVSPQVIYVPAYNPTVVFGPWWYPAYPPYYYYPPGYAVITTGIISFGVALTLGAAWGYAWGHPNWAHRHVYINPSQNIAINRFYPKHRPPGAVPGPGEWRHDPVHRKGVAYKDPVARQQFGHPGKSGANVRKDFKGIDQGSPGRSPKPGNPPEQQHHSPATVEQQRNPSAVKDRSSGQQRKETTGQGAMKLDQQASGHQKSTPAGNTAAGDRSSGLQKKETAGQGAMRFDQQSSGQRKNTPAGNTAGGDRQVKTKGVDGNQQKGSTTTQNRSLGDVKGLNPGGGEVKQQIDRSHSSQSVQTQKPGKPPLKGGKVNPDERPPAN